MLSIQDILLPRLDPVAPIEMYARLSEGVKTRLNDRHLHFRPGSTASLDTYFNGISVRALKDVTTIDSLYLRLEGQGRVMVRIGLHRFGHSHRWLQENEVTLPITKPIELPWASVEDGMLYVAVEAVSEAELWTGCFATASIPVAPTRLGIVITHFNRASYVVPAVARIRAALLDRPDCRDHVELVVVDNSQNLSDAMVDGATLVPSENYGGSGGFTRGLLHLKDRLCVTHCLFMDDDASCEVESIRRTLMLQRFARTSRLAISGGLLREMEPYRLHEQGAVYRKHHLSPLFHWSDVRGVDTLLHLQRNETKVDYGAWWFFCFRIDEVRTFPFPFFVRGDDALFSLLNKFEIRTFNGIACWGEDFNLKESPTTRYLGLRSTLAILLMTGPVGRPQLAQMMAAWFFASLLSYNYASAEALCMAIEDVAQGPHFWRRALNMKSTRAVLAPLNAREKMTPQALASYDWACMPLDESRVRRLLRVLSLNGIFLPGMLMRNIVVREPKDYRAALRRIFLARKVLYIYEPLCIGYVAEFDRRAALRVLLRFIRATFRILVSKNALTREYQKELPAMTNEKFWRTLYRVEAN